MRALEDVLFSVKVFAAGCLALYIGFSLDLPRPYWALATVYIVSNPLSGALRSKAFYRFAGTLLGAVSTVILVPNLATAPVLLAGAMALWVGTCLFFALLDRTPRGYVFMLAGYSAAIIGFPTVAAPDTIFDTAVARVEEIGLGIACATAIGSTIFPREVGPVLAARIDAWLRDAARWSLDALGGDSRRGEATRDCRRLAADAVELAFFSTHLAYDTSRLRGRLRRIEALQGRMVMLLPVLSAIGDRMRLLRQSAGGAPPRLLALAEEIARWVRRGDEARPGEALRLRAAIAREQPAIGAETSWPELVRASLLARLRELVVVLQECRELRRAATTRDGLIGLERPAMLRGIPVRERHRDFGMAALSAAGVVLTLALGCWFWIASAWTDGAVACQMAAIACCFFAAQDNPVPAILGFLAYNAVGVVVAALYLVAILPAIDGFPMLVLVLAPLFIPLGLGITRPAWYGRAMPIAATTPAVMALQSNFSADFAAVVNSGLAMLAGMSLAALVTALVRSVGAEWSARRLLRAGWTEIAAAAARPDAAVREALAGRMLDRLGLLVPRLANVSPESEVAGADALVDLRVGLNIVDLQRFRTALPAGPRRAVDLLLDSLARYYGARRHGDERPQAAVRRRLDRALRRTSRLAPVRSVRTTCLALVGIRLGLFPTAAPWSPAPPEPRMSVAA